MKPLDYVGIFLAVLMFGSIIFYAHLMQKWKPVTTRVMNPNLPVLSAAPKARSTLKFSSIAIEKAVPSLPLELEYYKLYIPNDPDDYKNYWLDYHADNGDIERKNDELTVTPNSLLPMRLVFKLSGGVRLSDESLSMVEKITIKPKNSLKDAVVYLLDEDGLVVKEFPQITQDGEVILEL